MFRAGTFSYVIGLFCLVLSLGHSLRLSAQQQFRPWMVDDVNYFRIAVSNNEVVRIPFDSLPSELKAIDGNEIQLFHHGTQVPRFVSNPGSLSQGDYIEFFGQENDGTIDAQLFEDPVKDQINPEYNLFSDTSYYYLAATGGQGIEYTRPLFNQQQPLVTYSLTKIAGERPENYLKSFGASLTSLSTYSNPEGWVGNRLTGSFLVVFRPSRRRAGEDGRLVYSIITDRRTSTFDLTLNGNVIQTFSVQPFTIYRDTIVLPDGLLSGRNEVQVTERNGETFYASLFNAELPDRDYPDMSTGSFIFVRQNEIGERIPQIAAEDLIVYDPIQGHRYEIAAGDSLRLSNGESYDEVYFNDQQNIRLTSAFNRAKRIEFSDPEIDYIIVTSDKLLGSELNAYANLRRSPQGGGHKVQIISVDDLYDEYGFGSLRNPLSLKYMLEDAGSKLRDLRHVFIVGKGLEYGKYRTSQDVIDNSNFFHVPTYGFPASDVLLSVNSTGIPTFAIGRLSAVTKNDISIYFDKMSSHIDAVNGRTYDPSSAWKKKIIHLGGGDLSIQASIAQNLNQMGNVIENSTFAANLSTYYKNSDVAVQDASSPALAKEIDEGAAIITFFGHSAPGSFDFNLDNPENYDNEGKLPLLISLGCYSGQIHSPFPSIGESFIFAEETGAIAYLATTSFGYISLLSNWGVEFYQNVGGQSDTSTLGEHLEATYTELQDDGNVNLTGLLQQMTLLGDPAVRIYPSKSPDYLISNSLIEVSNDDSFGTQSDLKISYEMLNIGNANIDSFNVQVRLFNSSTGLDTTELRRVYSPYYSGKDSVIFSLNKTQLTGLNNISIELDTDNEIDEGSMQGEQNNSNFNVDGQSARFVVTSSETSFVYPYHMQVVDSDSIYIVTFNSTARPDNILNYEIQIASDSVFSNVIYSKKVSQEYPLNELTVSPTDLGLGTYFMRTKLDSNQQVGESISFEIGNSNEAYSFNSEQRSTLDLDGILEASDGSINFGPSLLPIRVYNGIHPGQSFQAYRDIDRVAKMRGSTINSGVYVLVFDGNALIHRLNPSGGLYGSQNGLARSIGIFPYRTSTTQERSVLLNFLENEIPSGSVVGFVTIQREGSEDYHGSEWGLDSTTTSPISIINWLEDQGASQIRNISEGEPRPYVFLFRKDGSLASERSEGLARSPSEAIDLTVNFASQLTAGTFNFPKLGPSYDFDELLINLESFDSQLDEAELVIRQVNSSQGNRTTKQSLSEGLSNIDLDIFDNGLTPSTLEIRINVLDTVLATPADVSSVKASFTPIPDYVIFPDLENREKASGVQLRDSVRLKYILANPTIHEGLNPLLISTAISEGTRLVSNLNVNISGKAPLTDSVLTDVFYAERNGEYIGSATFEVQNGVDHNLQNNFASSDIDITRDEARPLVSLYGDGDLIIDGQLVSTSPIFELRLIDDNTNAFTDIADIDIQIKIEGSDIFVPITDIPLVSLPELQGDKGTKRYTFQPEKLPDGISKLQITVKDPSENISALLALDVEVDSKFSIASMVNYPNPFVDRTRFSYEMRGDLPVLDYQLNIYSVSGRIVRSLSSAELGPLKVGQHLTEGYFDGRDQFGQQLARGVYLYRLDLSDELDREQAENSDESPLERFGSKEGFGKMVIIR